MNARTASAPLSTGKSGLREHLVPVAYGAGILPALIGGGHFIAWLTGYMALRGFSAITMKTNAALALLLGGIALVLLVPERIGRPRLWTARGCAAVVLLIGLLTLSQHLFGWDLGIDQLLAQEPPGALGARRPNRPGPPASLIFTLAGISLLCLSSSERKGVATAQSLAVAGSLIALLGTIGHLYGVRGLFAVERWTAIAWPTAAGLLIFGIGLLCARPGEGIMAPLTRDDPGGAIIRRLLLPAILLPLGLGWLRLIGEFRGLYDTAQGTAFLVLTFMVVFSLIIIQSGRRLSRAAAAEREAVEALRESEAKFRAVFEQAAVGMARVCLSTARWIDVNKAFCRMLGYSPEEMRATPWPQMTHPDDLDLDLIPFRRMAAGELDSYSVEKRFIHKEGHHVWARLTLSIVRDSRGEPDYEIAVIEDITGRKQAEEELQRTTALLRATLDNTPDFIFVKDRQGRMLAANSATLASLGKSAEEVIGRTDAEFLGGEAGRIIMENDRRVMESGETLVFEEIPHPEGDRRIYLSTKSAWRDREGKVIGMVGVSRDITERKRAEEELRRLKEDLETRVEERTAELSAANRELEAFTYTVSHDLRAPLRHITSFVELLGASAGLALPEEQQRYMRIISEAARRMGTLIDDLLTFSRIGRAGVASSAVDLGSMVAEARRELEPESAGREIEWIVGMLPRVRGDGTLLRTVMVNLLSNALKYTRGRSPALIEVGSRKEEGEVVVFVRDNGAGFDMRYSDKLFGVFQRLHPAQQFEGTGIGLASVRRIIQRHGGRVWAEGEVDKGATFYFTLPAQESRTPV